MKSRRLRNVKSFWTKYPWPVDSNYRTSTVNGIHFVYCILTRLFIALFYRRSIGILFEWYDIVKKMQLRKQILVRSYILCEGERKSKIAAFFMLSNISTPKKENCGKYSQNEMWPHKWHRRQRKKTAFKMEVNRRLYKGELKCVYCGTV